MKKILGVTTVALAAAAWVFWSQVSAAFGPMEQHELQCLLCHRERIQKWVCGSKVRDDTITNAQSDWIDSFTPPEHEHIWCGHTSTYRGHWFGGTSIACGGIPTIPRIFEQRSQWGESKSRQLVARFQQLVKSQAPQIDFNELELFTTAVTKNPDSLLKAEKTEKTDSPAEPSANAPS